MSSNVIQSVVSDTVGILVVMLCVILCGIGFPVISSMITAMLVDSVTLQDCVTSVPFWIASILCTFAFTIYFIQKIEETTK